MIIQINKAARLPLHPRCAAGKQAGMALVVSLVLLVAMTVLGVATLSGTSLNEKITSNAQQKAIAFEVAESAIASIWDRDYLSAALVANPADSGNNPEPLVQPDSRTGITNDYDILSGGKGVNLDGEVSVQYCGEVAPIGSDLGVDESKSQFVYKLFDVNSRVEIANTSTRADHVQRGAITSARTNRTGACPAR